MEPFGFIILRHVNSGLTNQYWIECYNCIRKFYNDKIVIIDDNSIQDFLTPHPVENCIVIRSEFPKRGELLPYYYFYKYRWFSQVMMIHDSMFIQCKFEIPELKTVRFLWQFEHSWNNIAEEKSFITLLNHKETLNQVYDDKTKWKGCFGVMSVINIDFLTKIEENFGFFRFLEVVTTRLQRMCIERIFALLCHYLDENLISDPSILGDIHFHRNAGTYNYASYKKDKHNAKIVKVWSGR